MLGILPIKHGSPSVSMPGYDVRILDAEEAEVATGEMVEVGPKLALRPGAAVTLWNANDRFEEGYLQRYASCFITAYAGYPDRMDTSGWSAAPTTSSTSPGTGFRRARWRRPSP
ncbi:hypothetical protein CV770_22615 [Bradyrhizobium sp. AC87j1]|nr:hypothetical protein CV770_22615 [Bradyrhizobium sp. AC87j1]